MKTNVESMESEMQGLVSSMDAISKCSSAVNSSLADTRSNIDKLVRVRRLLKRLEFIFELPQRLRQSIELDTAEQAVKYYNMTRPLLTQYSHIPSFHNIERESQGIIAKLKLDLQSELDDVSIAPGRLAERTRLLLELQVPRTELRSKVLACHRSRLQALLSEAARSSDANVSEAPLLERVSSVNRAFLAEHVDAVGQYRELFVTGVDGEPEAMLDLLELTDAMFTEYFALLRAVFERALTSDAATASAAERDGEAERPPSARLSDANLEALVAALGLFIREVGYVHGKLPEAKLAERAAEVVEGVVRAEIMKAYGMLRRSAVRHLVELHRDASAALASGDERARDAAAVADSFEAESASAAHMLKSAAEHVLTDVDDALCNVQPLLRIGASVLDGAGAAGVFRSLAHASTWAFVTWLSNAMEELAQVTFPHDNDVTCVCDAPGVPSVALDGEGAPEDESLQVALPVLTCPTKFALLLACLCRKAGVSVVPETAALLGRHLPAARSGTDTPQEEDLRESISKAASRLLAHYVELHGNRLCQMIRRSFETPSWLSMQEPRAVREVIGLVLEGVREVAHEAAAALGEEVPAASLFEGGAPRGDGEIRRRGAGGARGGGVQLDLGVSSALDRIFTTTSTASVVWSTEGVCVSVLKLVLKSMLECARLITIGTNGLNQVRRLFLSHVPRAWLL